jgi:hypothetical protein
MTSEMVLTSLIDWPARDDSRRTYSKEFEASLAQGLAVEGLLQPIGLRPHPEKDGRYLGVFGEHRYGAAMLLKWEAIEAKVFVDMDDDDADMARDSENLWRNELSGAQRTLTIKSWHDHYVVKYPDRAGKGAEYAAKKRWDKQEKNASAPRADASDAPETAPAPVASLAKQVSQATGLSERQSQKEIQVARAFTEDQILAFEQCQVGKNQQVEIAKIKDEAQRNHCVNLVIGGFAVEDAIKRCQQTEPEYVTPGPGCSEEEMPDDEWFRHKCGTLADTMEDHSRYKNDALMYRELRETRQMFASRAKAVLKKYKVPKPGPFYRMVLKMSRLSHPCDWLRCGTCKGAGTINGRECPGCYCGDGYTTKTEG